MTNNGLVVHTNTPLPCVCVYVSVREKEEPCHTDSPVTHVHACSAMIIIHNVMYVYVHVCVGVSLGE